MERTIVVYNNMDFMRRKKNIYKRKLYFAETNFDAHNNKAHLKNFNLKEYERRKLGNFWLLRLIFKSLYFVSVNVFYVPPLFFF